MFDQINYDLVINRKTSRSGTSYAWLGSMHGVQHGQSITLDPAECDFATLATKGYLPSGTALAKIDNSDLYGTYDATATNGRQTLVGFLLEDRPVFTNNAAVPLLAHGTVRASRLPVALDPAAKDDVKLIDFI